MRTPEMKKIINFIHTDYFKSMKKKFEGELNKTLILYSKSGMGKSTLMNKVFKCVAQCLNLEPSKNFESSKINDDKTKVFYLADNNQAKEFYLLMLIVNGDQQVQIKY